MVSLTLWTWVWASSGSWWWTGKPGCCSPGHHKQLDMTERVNWTEWVSTTTRMTPPVLFRTCRSNSPCAFPQPQCKHQVLLSLLQILWMPQDLWGKNYSKIRKPCLMFFLSLPLVFCSLVWLIYVFFNIDNVTEEVARIHRRTVQKRSSWPR